MSSLKSIAEKAVVNAGLENQIPPTSQATLPTESSRGMYSPRFSALITLFISTVCGLGSERLSF